jgi:hypothetical protein
MRFFFFFCAFFCAIFFALFFCEQLSWKSAAQRQIPDQSIGIPEEKFNTAAHTKMGVQDGCPRTRWGERTTRRIHLPALSG